MVPTTHTLADGKRSFADLFELIPDMTAEVHRWGATEDGVLIEFTLSGTAGGKPISWDSVDRFTIAEDGLATERVTYFDSAPLALSLARSPKAWPERSHPHERLRIRQRSGSTLTMTRTSPGWRIWERSVEQADLAQDRDRVRVDVLALDQAVLEGDRVDPVPADARARSAAPRGRPGASCWSASRSPSTPAPRAPPARRAAASRTSCRARPRRSSRCAPAPPRPRPTPRRVVGEDHVRRVHRHDRVEVLRVPGVVVAPDRLGQSLDAVSLAHPHRTHCISLAA